MSINYISLPSPFGGGAESRVEMHGHYLFFWTLLQVLLFPALSLLHTRSILTIIAYHYYQQIAFVAFLQEPLFPSSMLLLSHAFIVTVIGVLLVEPPAPPKSPARSPDLCVKAFLLLTA